MSEPIGIPRKNFSIPEATDDIPLFHRIRNDIVACKLPPNSRLQMEDLKARYGIGLSPLRETLMRLEAEDLVVFIPNKGFRVAPASRELLRDLNKVRADLECLALKQAIELGDLEWESQFVASYHRLSRLSKFAKGSSTQINDAWSRQHRVFHSSLISACGSPILKSILSNLFDQAERYIVIAATRRKTPENDAVGHEAIMNAVLKRDVAKACELCRRHIELTIEFEAPDTWQGT